MALTITMAPEFKRACMNGLIDVDLDVFQVYLLDDTYPGYDPATQIAWTNVSSYELTTANGYTAGGKTLSGGAVTTDTQYAFRTFNTAQWQASDAGLTVGAAVVIDVTVSNKIVAVIDNDDVTVTPGLYYTLANPTIRF